MKIRKSIIINCEKGLHARVTAMLVHKASELQKKYNVELFVYYKDREKIRATSLMPFVNLKVKNNEEITIEAAGDEKNNIKKSIDDFCDFIHTNLNMPDENTLNEADNIINDNTITLQQVIDSMINGVVVTDENDIVTVYNPSAEKILGVSSGNVLGKKIYDIFPNSKIHVVNKLKKPEVSSIWVLGNSKILNNISPIFIDGESKGVVSIFEDISKVEKVKGELKEVKELKERLQLILESVQDGICVLDKHGTITYVNPAYLRIINEEKKEILGKSIDEVSPNGTRKRVLMEGRTIRGAISHKPSGVTIVSNVSPIIIDNNINGVVSIIKNVTEIKQMSEKISKLSAKAEYLEQELLRTKKPSSSFSRFKGTSGKIIDILAIASKAAKVNTTVLIRGESGTGKEVISEGIHYASNSKGSFIRVNCAAIPKNLLESELFGHEKGAFTGAVKRKLGKFELADKGTIFLDEIGEMELDMQAKVLRVIEEKQFERVGGEETIKVDVRIIAATHRDLECMVKKGEFREDLYYRLNVIPIIIPPLRERREDIPLLIEYFINKIKNDVGKDIKGITSDAVNILINYKWPGNVRELQNIIERMITLCDSEYIDIRDLPMYIKEDKNKPQSYMIQTSNEAIKNIISSEEILTLKEYEKIIIEKALKKYGSFNAAGKALGITHKTVAAKARQYGIEKLTIWE